MRIALQHFQANPAHLQLGILGTKFRLLTPENKMEAFQWVLHYLPFPSSSHSSSVSEVRTKFRALGVSNRLCFHRFDLWVASSFSQTWLMVLEKHSHASYTVDIHKLKVYVHCFLLINSLKYFCECSPGKNWPKNLRPQAASLSYAVRKGMIQRT